MGAGDQEFINVSLELINKHRAAHGCPPLALDSNLMRDAQAYADKLCEMNVNRHSADPLDKYSEVLAHKKSTDTKKVGRVAAEWAVEAWYGEEKKYNFDHPAFNNCGDWGHFSAMIWKDSSKMGIGIAHSIKTSQSGNQMNCIWVVGRFLPVGNCFTPESMAKNVPRRIH